MNTRTQIALGVIIGNYVSTLFVEQNMSDVHGRAFLIGTIFVFVECFGKFGPERSFLRDLFSVFTILNVKRGIRNLSAPGALYRAHKTMARRKKQKKFLRNPLKTHTMANKKKKKSSFY